MLDAGPTGVYEFDDALVDDLVTGQVSPDVFDAFIDRVLPNPLDHLCCQLALLLLHLVRGLEELTYAILEEIILHLEGQFLPIVERNEFTLAQYLNDLP